MFSNFYKNDIYFLKLFKYINFRKLYEKITLNYLTVDILTMYENDKHLTAHIHKFCPFILIYKLKSLPETISSI